MEPTLRRQVRKKVQCPWEPTQWTKQVVLTLQTYSKCPAVDNTIYYVPTEQLCAIPKRGGVELQGTQ